jgi:hypothetical protein
MAEFQKELQKRKQCWVPRTKCQYVFMLERDVALRLEHWIRQTTPQHLRRSTEYFETFRGSLNLSGEMPLQDSENFRDYIVQDS